MKVLTLREPWAGLIALGSKKIETRSWKTNYRGEIFIHAGLGKAPASEILRLKKITAIPSFHHGKIFAKCSLTDCVRITEDYAEKIRRSDPVTFACGDFTPGRYAWILEAPCYVPEIEVKGKLGLWDYLD